jgi:hypothetical protein
MYEIGSARALWDMANMAKSPAKKGESERRALELAARLEEIRPDDLTERQWCIKAGVSSSFFSNLRGTPTKQPSEPSIGNLRLVLETAGTTLPEFFVAESRGRVVRVPSRLGLERAFAEALPGLPRAPDRRAEYLVQVVADVLELPAGLREMPGNDEMPGEGGPEESAPVRRATK